MRNISWFLLFALLAVEGQSQTDSSEAEQGVTCSGGLCSVNHNFDPGSFLEKYPNALDDDAPLPAEERVQCPFLRMVKRFEMVKHRQLSPLFWSRCHLQRIER